MQNDRENLVYLAKLAEQAERFDEMATTGAEGTECWGDQKGCFGPHVGATKGGRTSRLPASWCFARDTHNVGGTHEGSSRF